MQAESKTDEHRLLAKLAIALVEAPRANLQELASHAGVSKATLYRFCRTRDQLISRVSERCIEVVDDILADIESWAAEPLKGLQQMTLKIQEHRELMAFIGSAWNQDEKIAGANAEWLDKWDAFFLRGQEAGIFRIDVPAAVLSELWGALCRALMDAERRGRAARAGLPALMQAVFLDGVRATQPSGKSLARL
jgi:TetR/AcrR family transcriptional repressor of mexCD-oprJ operon